MSATIDIYVFLLLLFFFVLPKPNLDSRSVTQWLLSSASTLRCSCCPRRSCGCLTVPWVSVKGQTLLSLKVRQCCHPKARSQHYKPELKNPSVIQCCCCCVFPALGSTIYGRVMVDPVQNLGDSFSCSIEKVFLCTGADGYVPKYNPTNKEYGCLADAPSLLYRFKILVGCSEHNSLFSGRNSDYV